MKMKKARIFEKILLFQEKKKLKQLEINLKHKPSDEFTRDEELALEIFISDIESDDGDSSDLNPFTE